MPDRQKVTTMPEASSDHVRLAEIDLERERLKAKYELSTKGLKSGGGAVGLVFLSMMAVLAVAYFTSSGNTPLLTGWQIVTLVFILVAGLVAYFSLVFWREVKLSGQFGEVAKVEIKTEKSANGDA